MALYNVTRTDEVQPGEFVSACVIAGGSALARKTLEHLQGVSKDGQNLRAERVDIAKRNEIVSIYFDEREANA